MLATKFCSRVSNNEELMGISGVWKGFFITASASARQLELRRDVW